MRIFVLGHRGMLGHVAAEWFRQRGHEVLTSDLRYAGLPRDPLVEAVRESGADWVVNAVGRIPQKGRDPGEMYLVNTRLPLHLGVRLHPRQGLIHPGTDCVFSGRTGGYRTHDTPDAEDDYGLSKALGEAVARGDRRIVIRCSVIGPELGPGHGLLGWFLARTGRVPGYTNHRWNGLTTLEWARLASEIAEGRTRPPAPLFQSGTDERVSKHRLLTLAAAAWGHPVAVDPVTPGPDVDRTLVPDLVRAPIGDQLRELAEWYRASFPPRT